MENKQHKNYTFLETFRYERKFRPEILNLHQIHNIVLNSKPFFRRIYHPRYINNIYLDTPEFDAFYDNVGGKSDRKKYRIRWYGDKLGKISGAIFEIKIKTAYRGTKRSFFLQDFILDKNFSTKKCHNLLKASNVPQEILDEIAGMEIKLLNRYNRTYFRDLTGNFRLTTDSDIQYFKIHDNFNRFIESYQDKEIVIEIKYDEEYNESAGSIVNSMPFRLTRNSKYVDGIAKFYDVPL